jgi:hypothetical protein
MKRLSVLLAALALPVAAHAQQLPPATPAGQLVFYGHIKSLEPSGGRYVLRLDPALLLGGTTATNAAGEDLPAGTPQIEDFYARDESHRLLTFVVPREARVTVVTTRPGRGVRSTRVSVAELAQLLAGKNPRHRRILVSAAAFGYWVRVDVDQVRSLDAQYRP